MAGNAKRSRKRAWTLQPAASLGGRDQEDTLVGTSLKRYKALITQQQDAQVLGAKERARMWHQAALGGPEQQHMETTCLEGGRASVGKQPARPPWGDS